MPCHNDLLPANLIHDGEAMRIVDWEYAGMGNRYFDLGNLSVNNALQRGRRRVAARVLLGRAAARAGGSPTVRLMRIMSDLREAMWGVVQQAISELDFDFADYAAGALRARAGRVRGPALRRLARGRPAWRVTCPGLPAA